jgi:hypothetical protein
MTKSNVDHPELSAPARFGRAQVTFLVLYGAALWFLAAMIVQYVGPMGAFRGHAMLITYALVVPGTIPAILIGQKLARVSRSQTPVAVMIMTATALLLDGVAFSWFRTLYGTDPAVAMSGAAVILWGAGVGLVLGMMLGRPTSGVSDA